jgi:hypothetical protein
VSGVKFVEKQLLVGTPTEKQNEMLYVNGNNGMV